VTGARPAARAAAYLTKPLDVQEFLGLFDRCFDGTVTSCATT